MNEKVFAEVYGCSANQSDYEMALGIIKKNGFRIVNDANNSDLNIIFTCIVKTPTSDRMIHRLRELTKLNKPLIVAGCMPKTERKIIEGISPRASMIGPNAIHTIDKIIKKTLNGEKIELTKDLKTPKLCLPRIRKNPIIEICEISTGCLNACSFCEVKLAKGNLKSYPLNDIIKEIKGSLKEGCREIWLTSQDCGCWGMDKKSNLANLVNEICKINGRFLVRIGMMNPSHAKKIINDLLACYKSEKVFKFIHLPVQSGSDKILKNMNRNYVIKDFESVVQKFVNEFPMLNLSTDIIVGFPGETSKDFQKTIDLIKRIEPDIVNISKFGARPGTKAEKMKQISRKIINERCKKLTKIVRTIQLKKNNKWIGFEGEVLIDEVNDKKIVGRNFAYRPVILNKGKLGDFKIVKIKSASTTSLFGEILD
jgi:MiaB-like tRNA modifying enzyme